MAPQWEDKLNQAHSNAQLPKLQKTWEQAISSLRTPPEARLQLQPALALPLGAVPGKVTVINGATPAEISNLLAQATKAAQQSRIQNQVLVTQLDKLPFTVATVADALRHIGIPETRIRQLLLQVGLQSAENVNPTSLSPAQMRTLALVAALHGSEPTIIVARPFDGVEPHVARTLSDFLVVSALERQKAFVLINPGTTVEGWRGSDWANWHEIAPLSAPIQAIVGKPFGGMDLNIPQELLELQMARKALLSTKDTIDRSEAEDESETGVEFLEEKLARQDPFQDRI